MGGEARRATGVAVALAAALALYTPAPAGAAVGPRCDPIDPAACMLPFPNDYFTAADPSTPTGRRIDFEPAGMPRNAAGKPIDPADYNRSDGFSPGQLIVTKVPGLDTPEAFRRTDPVGLHDLSRYRDRDAPVLVINTRTGRRHPIWAELDRSEDLDGNPPAPADTTFLIRPAVNFEEGTRYVVALRRLKNAAGGAIPAGPAFRALRDGGEADPARRTHYEKAVFPVLKRAKVERAGLYLAWDFTVASERSLAGRALSIRDRAFAELGDTNLADLTVQGSSPKFVIDEVTQSLPCRPTVGIDVPPVNCDQEELDPRIARRVEGRVIVPCYLDQPGCPAGSRFAFGPGSDEPLRLPGNTYTQRFICNIPKEALSGQKMRPSLYGHGLFGSADEVNSGKLYALGDDGLMLCGSDWLGMSEEDLPNALSTLPDLSRSPTMFDRVQQGMLGFLYIGRAMIHPEGFGSHPAFQVDGEPVIDQRRLFYDGGSQGGIIGGSLTALAPDFDRAALGVPGMNYSTLLSRSVDFDTFAQVLYRAYPNELERQLVFSMVQMLWDRSEANGYAHHMTTEPLPGTPPHAVLMHEAFGDHQVTNWATEVMARTAGARLREPGLDPGRHPAGDKAFFGLPRIGAFPYSGSAFTVFDVGPLRDCDAAGENCKGTTPPPVDNVPNRAGVDPHGPDGSETPDGQRQIAEFLKIGGRAVAVCGDAPCYLDGWTGPGG